MMDEQIARELQAKWADLFARSTAAIVKAQCFLKTIRMYHYSPWWKVWQHRMGQSTYAAYREGVLLSLDTFRITQKQALEEMDVIEEFLGGLDKSKTV